MWYGPNLQRSYKYMMFASKVPSLRMEQSDLKCKNGCDYFGNPQWQGYCSKCHREQMQKQRRAEKATTGSATLPKPEQKKSERSLKLASHSSFSKFEEKRQRQSETLKKKLQFSVFKKSNTDDHDQDKRPAEFKIPAQVFDHMKGDFRLRFANLTPQMDRDARAFVQSFIMDVIKYANVMSVDELSERVQRQYQRFMKHMDTSPNFANVESDTKERLMDFVEKHAMTYLHDLPSVVFSPSGTEDERADRGMSERIQQLSWVCERRLDCKLDRDSARCRQLLYKAISELLGMDSAASPGGKLSRVRRCCRHVLALCQEHGAPASADDLLPALIFTVLKANPPRLVSNINFVTRFCNAQRLMTGEGGYYFTNLCCAVSFIENLNAESLNMDKKEFDCYMAMPASIGGSAWAAALSLCGAAREAEEQSEQIRKLLERARQTHQEADRIAANSNTFEEQISKKVKDVLAKTPLEITPRRELPRVGKLKEISTAPLVELAAAAPAPPAPAAAPPAPAAPHIPIHVRKPSAPHDTDKLNILGFEVIENSPSKSPNDPNWDVKQNSLELLTPSPLGFTPFDSRSIDELMTPDEFGPEAPGLNTINYDIDLSDFSGDNSIADDAPKPKDPFSPDGMKKFDPFAPQTSQHCKILDTFDEFSFDSKASDPFEVVHRTRDPFSPVELKGQLGTDPFSPVKVTGQSNPFSPVEMTGQSKTDPFSSVKMTGQVETAPFSPLKMTGQLETDPFSPLKMTGQLGTDPFSPRKKESSILDDSGSPTAACLLPSPLQPQHKPT